MLAEDDDYRLALGVLDVETWNSPDYDEEGNIAKATEAMLAMPYGAIVALARLADCQSTTKLITSCKPGGEYWLGNYDRGRFGWMLEDVQPLAEPIPFTGAQGFFDVPDNLFEDLRFAEALEKTNERHGNALKKLANN